MLQLSQETEFNFSLYISSDDEEARKQLTVRPINKDALMASMALLKLEGQWRATQTACGLIISFMKEDDLLTFQTIDISSVLGLPASAYSYSSLDTYRQRVLIRDVPWVLPDREIEAALNRQGVTPLSSFRTRHGNIILELGNPNQFNKLLQDGFDFYSSAKFAVTPLPMLPPGPAPPAPPASPRTVPPGNYRDRDNVVQCYKCQGFWHYAAQCPNIQRCVRCGDTHAVVNCPRPRNDPLCAHCGGRHHAAYKHCPVRLQMKNFPPLPPVFVPYIPPPYTQ